MLWHAPPGSCPLPSLAAQGGCCCLSLIFLLLGDHLKIEPTSESLLQSLAFGAVLPPIYLSGLTSPGLQLAPNAGMEIFELWLPAHIATLLLNS